MQTCRFKIVALPFYEVGECLNGFMAEASGRIMTVRPDPTNDYDPNSFGAYDWQGRHVGYVSSNDLDDAWRALRGSGRHSLRGRITEAHAEHKYLMFECSVEVMADAVDLNPPTPYLEWEYSGPTLKYTQQMVTLDYMMDEISERLDEYSTWTEDDCGDFVKLTERFCDLSKYDLSGDMSDYRKRLCIQLHALANDILMPLIEDLQMAAGRTGRETHGGSVLDYWMQILAEPKVVKQLLVHRQEYDVEKIREQLKLFPDSMYNEWIENRERFVPKLLYHHIPRQVLWQFVSGIAFCEAVKVRDQETIASAIDHNYVKFKPESPIYLSRAKGQKIDIIRVLDVLYDQGRFYGKDGAKLTKKDFFSTMGDAMNTDLTNYDKDLSRSMSDSTKLEKHLKVFEDMRDKMKEKWNSK